MIDLELIIGTYRRLLTEHGQTSCGKVAIELRSMGVRTDKGMVPTRQAIHWRMQRDPRGRELLAVTKQRIHRPEMRSRFDSE